MRDHKDLWEWEYQHYKGKKSNPYWIWYMVMIIVWAILAVAMLLSVGMPEEEPVTAPPVEIPAESEEEKQEAVVFLAPRLELPAESEEETQLEEPEDPIEEPKLNQFENAKITAYCICKKCCGKDPDHPAYGITASGRKAVPHVSVAVDRKLIPLGSTVYIDYGDGVVHQFRADDVGGSVKGEHIDVCYPDHQSALVHGVKTARVWWEESL